MSAQLVADCLPLQIRRGPSKKDQKRRKKTNFSRKIERRGIKRCFSRYSLKLGANS
jgi:hypothetical protein